MKELNKILDELQRLDSEEDEDEEEASPWKAKKPVQVTGAP